MSSFDQLTFDLAAGQDAGEQGQDVSAQTRRIALECARDLAHAIANASPSRTVTADDVQEAMIRNGWHPAQLGNAAGSIFKGDEWHCVGYCQSRRVSNHARLVRVWELRQ